MKKLSLTICTAALSLAVAAAGGVSVAKALQKTEAIPTATNAVTEKRYDMTNARFEQFYSGKLPFMQDENTLFSNADGELKAVLKDFASNTFDASFTLSPISDMGKINAGLYFNASDPSNAIDGIDALNVQVEKNADSNFYTVNVFRFDNGSYIGSVSNTINLRYNGQSVSVRAISDGETLNVYLDGSDVPTITKKLKTVAKTGLSVGLRSMFTAQRISDFTVTDTPSAPVTPTVKVLMVGNSYAQDTMTYAHEIAASLGVNMVCGVMFYGGCTVEQHWNFLTENRSVYTYFKNGGTDRTAANFDSILFDEDWDYITIQTGTGNQGLKETFYPYLPKLIAYIENNVPAAEIGLFESWAVPSCYEGTGNSRLSKYDDDSEKMYNAIIRTFTELQAENGVKFVVPSAEGLHRINDTNVCNNDTFATSFFRDSTAHVNEKGRYLLGLTIFKAVTGRSVLGVDYLPIGYSYGADPGIDGNTAQVVREVVNGLFGDRYIPASTPEEKVTLRAVYLESAKTDYAVGDYFDYSSVRLYADYSDGTRKAINYFNIDVMRPLTANDKEVTVTYRGKIAKVYITVK